MEPVTGNKTIVVMSSHTPSLFWFRMDMMLEFIRRGYSVYALGNEDESKWLSDTMKKQNMFYEPTMEELSTLYENTFGAPPPLMMLLGMEEDQMKKEIQEAIDSGTEIHVDLEPGAVI